MRLMSVSQSVCLWVSQSLAVTTEGPWETHQWVRSLWLAAQIPAQLLQLCDESLQSGDTVLQLVVDLTRGHICVHFLEQNNAEIM